MLEGPRGDRWLYAKSFLFALLLSCLALDAAYAQCTAADCSGDVLVGEDADNCYCMSRNQYDGSATQRSGSQFCRAQQSVAADAGAIRELGFALDAERLEMFGDVARKQKAELQQRILDALFEEGLEATTMVANSAKSLNPWNVNHAIQVLESKGFGNAAVITALRRIALQKDKPAMAAAYRDFVTAVKRAKEGWDAEVKIAEDPKDTGLRLLVGALKIMQGNSLLGLAITATELVENLAYLGYVGGKVDALTQISDEKLERLNALTGRLKSHVDEMVLFKKTWQKASGHATANPACVSSSRAS